MRRNETYRRYWDDEPPDDGLLSGLLAPTAPLAPIQQPVAPAGLLGVSWDQFYQPQVNTGSYLDRPSDLNLELREGNAAEIAKLIGYGGATTAPTTYMQGGMSEGGETTFEAAGNAYTPEFMKALEQYKFAQAEPYRAAVIDQSGQSLGTFKNGDEPSKFDKFAEVAIPMALAAMAGGALSGAEWAVGGGSGSAGSLGGAIGAGEGASQLAAWQAANPLTAAQVTAATLPAGGLPGLGGGLLSAATVAPEAIQAIEAFTAANPLTASQVAASTLPSGGMPGLGMMSINAVPESLKALEAYSAANPLTPAQVTAATLPAEGLPGLGGGLLGINAQPEALKAVEQYTAANPVTQAQVNTVMQTPQFPLTTLPMSFEDLRAAEKADMGQKAGNIPKTVNMGDLGGTMATAGGLQGAMDVASQGLRDMTASPEIGGDWLSKAGSTVADAAGGLGSAAQWMKDNPMLGRLLMGGATSLLSMSGGGGGSQASAGPAKQWSTPLQGGLLGSVKQAAPATWARQQPAGLLAQGSPYDGAWRYLKG